MSSVVLNKPAGQFDECVVMGFLKKLFAGCNTGKPSPEISVHHSITELKPQLEQLNAALPVEISYNYLLSLEGAMPQCRFRYAMVYRNGMPVLFSYFQLFTITSDNFKLNKNKGFTKGILKFFINLHKVKILQLGNILRTETQGYAYDNQVFSQAQALEAVAGLAEHIAAADKVAAVLLKDILPDNAAAQMLKDMGYQKPWDDQVMEMELDPAWNTLAAYTAALSKKYKARANKALTARKQLSITSLTAAQLEEYRPRMHSLYEQVSARQDFVLSHYGAQYFTDLKGVYGNDFEAFGFFDGDNLVAFFSAFVTAGAYEIYYIGIDYEANADYQLYFNILFTGLERALELKKPLLKLGRTSFDAKASLGAKPKSLDYLVKLTAVPDFVIKWFACYFTSAEDGKWKQRNPLKAVAG